MRFRDYSRQGIHYYSGSVQSQQWPFGMNILVNVIEFHSLCMCVCIFVMTELEVDVPMLAVIIENMFVDAD